MKPMSLSSGVRLVLAAGAFLAPAWAASQPTTLPGSVIIVCPSRAFPPPCWPLDYSKSGGGDPVIIPNDRNLRVVETHLAIERLASGRSRIQVRLGLENTGPKALDSVVVPFVTEAVSKYRTTISSSVFALKVKGSIAPGKTEVVEATVEVGNKPTAVWLRVPLSKTAPAAK